MIRKIKVPELVFYSKCSEYGSSPSLGEEIFVAVRDAPLEEFEFLDSHSFPETVVHGLDEMDIEGAQRSKSLAQEGNPMTQDELTDLAVQLGYTWPDDHDDQWEVLRFMAERAAHWRSEFARSQEASFFETEKEKTFKYQVDRLVKARRDLRNTRRALKEYMSSQAAFVREGLQEIKAFRDEREGAKK